MPRRHPQREPPPPPPRPAARAPAWVEVPGFEVRATSGGKPYRCPGCDHVVRPGTSHLVVVPEGRVEERRHWHSECWRRELRRLGLR